MEEEEPTEWAKQRLNEKMLAVADWISRNCPHGRRVVIADASSLKDLVSVIGTCCATLEELRLCGPCRYRGECKRLRKFLLKLYSLIFEVERNHPDVLRTTNLFGKIRIHVSRIYALAEAVSANEVLPSSEQICWSFRMFQSDPFVGTFQGLFKEMATLMEDIAIAFQMSYDQGSVDQDPAADSGFGDEEADFGIHKLDVVTPESLDKKIMEGQRVTIPVYQSLSHVGPPLYSVTIWLKVIEVNLPFWLRGRLLSATVEGRSDDIEDSNNLSHRSPLPSRGPKVFSVTLPEWKPDSAPHRREDVATMVANIATHDPGVMEAQVKTLQPEFVESPSCLSRARYMKNSYAASLLRRNHYFMVNEAGLGEHSILYEGQKYSAEIILDAVSLKINCVGVADANLRKLRVEGWKVKGKVWYKCVVDASEEVLAIYRHKCKGSPDHHGTLHLLGVANQPELRDVILCSFVAMGLTSEL